MDLKDAIQKAEKELGGKVVSVIWCFYKGTKEIGCFFPPDEPEVGKRAKRVPLPKE